jgi:hypothetical protein
LQALHRHAPINCVACGQGDRQPYQNDPEPAPHLYPLQRLLAGRGNAAALLPGDRMIEELYLLSINDKILQPLREFRQNVPRQDTADRTWADLAFHADINSLSHDVPHLAGAGGRFTHNLFHRYWCQFGIGSESIF